jgi:hypothetical protein
MSTVSRRDFASQMTAALSGAVAASLAAPMSAADPMTDKLADSTPKVEDHQLAILKELWPAPHLTEEMEKGIREGLKHNRALAERIRKVPLTHDVPPAFSFLVTPPAK